MSSKTRASSAGGTLIQSGTLAARPAAGVADRYYWATDTFQMFRDTGTAWQELYPSFKRIYFTSHLLCTLTANNMDPAAKVLRLSPIEVTRRSTVRALGFVTGSNVINGNFFMGLYDSDPTTLLPRNLIAQTASTSVVGLPGNSWVYTATTSNPVIEPGLYWVAFLCDTTYNAGVAGLQTMYSGNTIQANVAPGPINGPAIIQDVVVGAFALPNPCPATVGNYSSLYYHALQVT